VRFFGDYVSVYNFAASALITRRSRSTTRTGSRQLEIENPTFGDDLMAIVEEADLDEDQQRQLGRALGQQYELITRDDRLEAVARDIVDHFLGRGFHGKAMVVSIDKVTTVRTFEKVQRFWRERLERNERPSAKEVSPTSKRTSWNARSHSCARRKWRSSSPSRRTRSLKMAERGLTSRCTADEWSRRNLRTVQERVGSLSLGLRLVRCGRRDSMFPRSRPCISDKPLRNHTLMQTITRANRVFPEKNNGLVVAYVDVFRNLQAALAIYAVGGAAGEMPVEEKGQLVDAVREAIEDVRAFCLARDVDLDDLAP